jgi:hypothetical protein
MSDGVPVVPSGLTDGAAKVPETDPETLTKNPSPEFIDRGPAVERI